VIWADGVHVEERGVFGQAWMPQRFQRIAALALAAARHRIGLFEETFPPAPASPAWLQARSDLPDVQSRRDYAHVYIDDTGGVGLTDLIPRSTWPTWLQDVDLGEAPRAQDGVLETSELAGPWPRRPWQDAADTAGGNSGHPEARYAVHARIAVGTFRELGFAVSAAKLQIADAVIQLGFKADSETRRISVPDAKRDAMLADTTIMRGRKPVETSRVQRYVGRLTHLATVLPGVKRNLHAGYSLIAWAGGNKRGRSHMPMFTQGRLPSQEKFQVLLDVAEGMLKRGDSVPFAGRLGFPHPVSVGMPVFVTDASGFDHYVEIPAAGDQQAPRAAERVGTRF